MGAWGEVMVMVVAAWSHKEGRWDPEHPSMLASISYLVLPLYL